jgi:large conductance mechanosensitive channel
MWKEFKDFISRGNVIDLAVGVIIGTAFTAIITSLVDDMFMPVIGAILGGTNIEGLALVIGDATIGYGKFLNAVINFLLIALILFFFIRAIAKVNISRKEEEEKAAEEVAPPEPSGEEKLLAEILDLLENKIAND